MSLRAAVRASLTDFYFNSWRLVPANLVWGAVFVLALLAGPTLLAVPLLVALAVPTAGVYRMATLIARGEPAALSDFVEGMRRFGLRALAIGLGAAILAAVFVTNIVVGLQSNGPIGWFVSALALWGLVGMTMGLVVMWPLLVDPLREGVGIRRLLALAGLAVIGRPLPLLALSFLLAVLLAVSTVLFALLLMVTIAFAALVSARYLLPLVDALEARLPEARRIR